MKSVKINNEPGQSLLGLQIYPNLSENSKSESLTERSKRMSRKLDFNIK